jgi:uncharacterized protein (UPF0335 family)
MQLILLLLGLNAGLLNLAADQTQSANSQITSEPSIEEVTVYLQGAQITHRSTVEIPEGRHTLVFTGLNSEVDSRRASVGFDGEGREGLEVVSVNHRTQQIRNPNNRDEIERLLSERSDIEAEINDLQTDLDVNSYEQQMLRENLNPERADAQSLRQLLELHRERIRSIEVNNRVLSDSLQTLRSRMNEINQTLRQSEFQPEITVGELLVVVQADQPVSAATHISYPIDAAGWTPEYDLHVDAAGEPVRGKLSASLYNNSRQPWNNVDLILSTQSPQAGTDIPELYPWFLDFVNQRNSLRESGPALSSSTQLSGTVTDARTGEPIAGANVRVLNMQAGTATDRNGRYSFLAPEGSRSLVVNYVGYQSASSPINGTVIDFRLQPGVPNLNEVVVTAYGTSADMMRAKAPPSTRNEQMVSREFEIRDKQTVLSDGNVQRISIEENSVESDLSYLTIPKIKPDAVLKADIDEWETLFPLPGTAMLHLEGTYVGQTYIDPSIVSDTLQVSFGKDDAIAVTRTKLSDESDKSFFRNRVTRTISHEISVRNTKLTSIDLEIMDQVPISMRDDIEVSIAELTGGELEEDTGIVTWDLQIPPGETRSVVISYEVQYPSGRSIYLD